MAVLMENIIFLDETGIWQNFVRTCGRSKRGKRCHDKRAKYKGKLVTLIGAMSFSGMLASLMFNGGTDATCFLFFITQVLVPLLWPGAVLVMDNLNVHTNKAIREAVEAVGAKVLFLPRYSPELNAIEMLWSKLKSYLRKVKARTREELDEAVSTFVNSLTPEDVLGYFLETSVRTGRI